MQRTFILTQAVSCLLAYSSLCYAQQKPAAPPTVAELQQKADAGNAEAQVALASLILSGEKKDSKLTDALALLEKAADKGSALGQFSLAKLLGAGAPGIPADPERALFLLQSSAEGGYAPAQAGWGKHLQDGVDAKEKIVDYTESAAWLKKAADQKDPEGLCLYGMACVSGMAPKTDAKLGYEMLRQAAQSGHPVALNEVGVMLQRGQGVEQDYVAAVGYFHAAADLGNGPAALNLGICYRDGLGIPSNMDKAGASLAAAAKRGLPLAQLALGQFFEKGIGTPVNLASAFVNYSFAARSGSEEGKKLADALEMKLSPEDRRKADAILNPKKG